MAYIYGIDPGAVTGITLGQYTNDQPFRIHNQWEVDFGALGFRDWWRQNAHLRYQSPGAEFDATFVVERFDLNMGNEFKADLTGVQVEGAVMALIDPNLVVWHSRSQKQKAGMYDAILKKNNMWTKGSSVNWTDGRDVNDATIHCLEYLRTHNHMPTLRKYFRGENSE